MSKPIRKEDLLKFLEQEDIQVLSLAYVYAKNMKLYGEDVTKAWVTAVEQHAILEKAYRAGYYEGLRRSATEERQTERKCENCKYYDGRGGCLDSGALCHYTPKQTATEEGHCEHCTCYTKHSYSIADNAKVKEFDKDHIWWKGKQFISLNRVSEMKREWLGEHPNNIANREKKIAESWEGDE